MDNREISITYVGDKAVKHDTIAGTDTIWFGKGDAQVVPYKQGVQMLMHPDVWMRTDKFKETFAEIDDEQSSPPSGSGPTTETEENKNPSPPVDKQEDDKGGEKDPDTSEEDSKDASIQKIMAAISSLDYGNPEHFNESGMPKVPAVRQLVNDESVEVNQNTVKKAYNALKK